MFFDKSQDRATFGEIATEWDLELPGRTQGQILQELLTAYWRREFADEALGWNPHKARAAFDEDYLHSRKLGFQVRLTGIAREPDFEEMTPAEALYRLCDTYGETDLIGLLELEGFPIEEALDRVSEASLSDFRRSTVHRFLKNLVVTKIEFARWCRSRGWVLPAFWFAQPDDDATTSNNKGTSGSLKRDIAREVQELHRRGALTFRRGEQADLARDLAPIFHSPVGTIRRYIGPTYRELRERNRVEQRAG